MKTMININELIEKHGIRDLSDYMKRGTPEYKDFCQAIDFAFIENVDDFSYYAKALLSRFNIEDKSGGFIEEDKEVLLQAIKEDPLHAMDILAINREQRKIFEKCPYGYFIVELLRLVIFTQMERKKEHTKLIMPLFQYFDEESMATVDIKEHVFKVKDKTVLISRE